MRVIFNFSTFRLFDFSTFRLFDFSTFRLFDFSTFRRCFLFWLLFCFCAFVLFYSVSEWELTINDCLTAAGGGYTKPTNQTASINQRTNKTVTHSLTHTHSLTLTHSLTHSLTHTETFGQVTEMKCECAFHLRRPVQTLLDVRRFVEIL